MLEIVGALFIMVILVIGVTFGLDVCQYVELQRKLEAERERKGEQ